MKKVFLLVMFVLCLAASAFAKINVNTATVAELEAIKGIGPAKAEAIVRDREANGKFTSLQDLTRVKGIGPKLLEKIRDQVEISK